MMEDMAKMTDVMKEMMEAMMLGFEAQKARSGGTYTYTLRANPPPQPQPQPQWAMRQTLIATAIPRHDASASARANVEPASRADPGPPPSTTTTTTNKPPEVAPKHRMCRGLKNVESLWREWTVGFDGVPSIQALDRKWGTKWRSGRQAEQQWYSLRREVIREIKRIASTEGISEDAAVQQVQLQQQQMRCSLDHLCKRLRVERKARVESNPGVAVQ
ncbi:hypothetical protein N7535_006646 [Penicillium sp. DV-2018c]|nr:hypothetical protein N7461_007271 [Penicillium sp. DV-2018c]KAJ5567340.1 hypothetical protein N7535_006646 [Penicillium sp. DV-2018c]